MTNPAPPLRLNNVYSKEACPDGQEVIVCRVDRKHYNYFFRGILAGKNGPTQAILSQLFSALHKHLTEDLKLPAIWHESNEAKVAEILSRINFNERDPEPVADSRGTTSRRRPLDSPPKRKKEPAPKGRGPGTSSISRGQVPSDTNNTD